MERNHQELLINREKVFAVEKARSVREMSLKCHIFHPAGREIPVSSGKLMSV